MAVDPIKFHKAVSNNRDKSSAITYYKERLSGSGTDTEIINAFNSSGLVYGGALSSSSSGGGSSTDVSIFGALEAQSSTSKITDIGPNDSIDALKFMMSDIDEKKDMFLKEVIKQTQRESELHTEISEKLGLQGTLLEKHVNAIAESSITALKYGYNLNQITEMITTMSDKTGMFNVISKEMLDRSYATGRAFVGSLYKLGESFAEFQKVGIGAKNTLDSIDKSGRSSMSLGLNSKKTTELLRQEIGRLNEYGFSNGVDGLNRMVQRSLEFRMNMGEVFKIADKVMNPEGAIELTANMQMLGGAIGDLNDPLKLMYMATNNVEGLQDAMFGAVQNLATYNEEQGRFEVTGINLRRVREMANALGVDYKELTKGAIAAQERMMGVDALMGKGFQMSEADRELIINMSQMKDGKMTLTVPSGLADSFKSNEIALEDLTDKQIAALTKYQNELINMNPTEIAMNQFTEVKQIRNMMAALLMGDVRNLSKETLGKGGILNFETIFGEGFNKTVDALTKKQQVGETGLLGNQMEEVLNLVKNAFSTPVFNLAAPIKDSIDSLTTALRERAKEMSGTPEEKRVYEERIRKIEMEQQRSNPATMIHKHEFKIIDKFGSPALEYINSYTVPAVNQ